MTIDVSIGCGCMPALLSQVQAIVILLENIPWEAAKIFAIWVVLVVATCSHSEIDNDTSSVVSMESH